MSAWTVKTTMDVLRGDEDVDVLLVARYVSASPSRYPGAGDDVGQRGDGPDIHFESVTCVATGDDIELTEAEEAKAIEAILDAVAPF